MTFSSYLNVKNFPRVLEKQMRSHCSFMCIFEVKTFLSLQMQWHGPVIWATFNFIWYLHSILFVNITIRLKSWNLYFLQLQYLQRYIAAAPGRDAPLYSCFELVDGTIARICRLALNERVVYSHYTRLHGAKV